MVATVRPPTTHPVLDAAARFRAQLLARERQAASRLVDAYGRAYARLQPATQALADQIDSLRMAGAVPSEAAIRKLAAMQSLQAQIAAEVERYAAFADVEISTAVSQQIVAGLNDSLGMVQANFLSERTQAAIAARWDMLPAESVETMLGYTAADSPLRGALVGRLGEVVADRAGEALVTGIATGMNPRDVARVLRREMGAGLSWSLSTARTAQLWSYRDSTRLSYLQNRDIVSGWRWLSAADERTCPSCWAQHGSVHDVTEVLADHHQGRCTQVPIVPLAQRLGLREPPIGSGPVMFAALPEVKQQQIMGQSMWDAWKDGAFEFQDLTRPYDDPIYGSMMGAPSLKELLGEAADKYKRRK